MSRETLQKQVKESKTSKIKVGEGKATSRSFTGSADPYSRFVKGREGQASASSLDNKFEFHANNFNLGINTDINSSFGYAD